MCNPFNNPVINTTTLRFSLLAHVPAFLDVAGDATLPHHQPSLPEHGRGGTVSPTQCYTGEELHVWPGRLQMRYNAG